jgi:Ran GTPase-activating protein (RanGAP) involved in mRNA processing and transport
LTSLQNLNLSDNNLGLEGSIYLGSVMFKMKVLKQLHLKGCNLTDRGATVLFKALEEDNNSVEVIDFSNNFIG